MKWQHVLIEKSKPQQLLFVEKVRVELACYGFSIIRTDRLDELKAKLPLVDRLKTMLVD